MVCGKNHLDIKDFKEHTEYEGFNINDNNIKWFWEWFEETNEKNRIKYLKFVSGRSRLPDPRNINFYHIISMITEEDIDQKIPTSSIRHFTLYLPNYSSYEVLIEKLRYAINNHSINPENLGDIYYDE